MALTVMNTLSRRKQELAPREPGKIGMYVCGPTVYNHIHIGNARSAIVFDTIRRYLRHRGFEVQFVQNYTDVDDKIIAKAAEEGRSPDSVADDYSRAYEAVMKAVNVEPPDILVRATDHIEDMIATITQLIERGCAYEAGGSVWFAVEKFPGYGKLSGRSLEDIGGGERIEPDPNKLGPADFALWKAAKAGEPAWESPWGPGRPGWHIECSTMSTKYLGMGFDIHGGGSDLVFPHHENEIAQAEGATGEEPFVRYWLHNGMVKLDEEKMSKSLGNYVLAKDFLEQLPGSVLRLMTLAGHYRSDVDFGEDAVAQAKRTLTRFENFATAVRPFAGDFPEVAESADERTGLRDRFLRAMDDDFNTPVALSVIHEIVKRGNSEIEAAEQGDEPARARLGRLWNVFAEATSVLGLEVSGEPKDLRADSTLINGLIELTVQLREQARKARRFDEADQVRSALASLGVELEDTPSGTRWRMKT